MTNKKKQGHCLICKKDFPLHDLHDFQLTKRIRQRFQKSRIDGITANICNVCEPLVRKAILRLCKQNDVTAPCTDCKELHSHCIRCHVGIAHNLVTLEEYKTTYVPLWLLIGSLPAFERYYGGRAE